MGATCSASCVLSEAPKIIVVFGSTGAQGGGVIRAILEDTANSTYKVRAVTRDPTTEKAIALRNMGAEVIKCDINIPSEVEEALEGAYGAFFATNPFDPTSCPTPDTETKQIKTFAEASANVGLKHAILSTTEDTRKLIPLNSDRMPTLIRPSAEGIKNKKEYKIPHFECKADGETYFIQNGVPTTFIMPGFYFEHFLTYFLPKKAENGTFSIILPTAESKLALVAAEDIGKACYNIFKQPTESIGKHIGLSGDHLSVDEVANILSELLGETIQHNKYVDPETFRTFGFPGCEELANMLQYERDFEKLYCGLRGVDASRKWCPSMENFKTWAEQNKQKFNLSSKSH